MHKKSKKLPRLEAVHFQARSELLSQTGGYYALLNGVLYPPQLKTNDKALANVDYCKPF